MQADNWVSAIGTENGVICQRVKFSIKLRFKRIDLVSYPVQAEGLVKDFSFSLISCLTKAEEPSLPYYLPIVGGRIIGFIPFPKVLVLCEMQSVSCRIWNRVILSIFYDDNHYTTGYSFYDKSFVCALSKCEYFAVKCNQSRPGFELVSPCPFPTTITIKPWAPPFYQPTSLEGKLWIQTC